MKTSLFLLCVFAFLYATALKIHIDSASTCLNLCDGSKRAPFPTLISGLLALEDLFQSSNNTTAGLFPSHSRRQSQEYLVWDPSETKISVILANAQVFNLDPLELRMRRNLTDLAEGYTFFNSSVLEAQNVVIEFKDKNKCKEGHVQRRGVLCEPPVVVVQSQEIAFAVKTSLKFSGIRFVGNSSVISLVNDYYGENNTNETQENNATNEENNATNEENNSTSEENNVTNGENNCTNGENSGTNNENNTTNEENNGTNNENSTNEENNGINNENNSTNEENNGTTNENQESSNSTTNNTNQENNSTNSQNQNNTTNENSNSTSNEDNNNTNTNINENSTTIENTTNNTLTNDTTPENNPNDSSNNNETTTSNETTTNNETTPEPKNDTTNENTTTPDENNTTNEALPLLFSSLFIFSQGSPTANISLEFSNCIISSLQSNYTSLITFSPSPFPSNISYEVLFKSTIINDLYLNNLINDNSPNPLLFFAVRIKSCEFLYTDPAATLSSPLFTIQSALSSKFSLKNSRFQGVFPGSLLTLTQNSSRISLKNCVFEDIRLHRDFAGHFIQVSNGTFAKFYNITVRNSSFSGGFFLHFSHNNTIILNEFSFYGLQGSQLDPSYADLLRARDSNLLYLSNISIFNCTFTTPVTHFSVNSKNSLNLTGLAVVSTQYTSEISNILFNFAENNSIQANNSVFQEISFTNVQDLSSGSSLFRMEANNTAELADFSLNNLENLQSFVELLEDNAFFAGNTVLSNISLYSLDNAGVYAAKTANILYLSGGSLTNCFLRTEVPEKYGVLASFSSENTAVLTNFSFANETLQSHYLLFSSPSGHNTYILDNLSIVSAFDPEFLLQADATDAVEVLNNGLSLPRIFNNHTINQGLFFDIETHGFSLCSSGCLSCGGDQGACNSCDFSVNLSNNSCECAAGAFITPEGCEVCGSFCEKCANSQKCEQCFAGFAELSQSFADCALEVTSNHSFSRDGGVISWSFAEVSPETLVFVLESARNSSFYVEFCSVSPAISQNNETISAEFNLSFQQIALCGEVSEDLNYTFYDFRITAVLGNEVAVSLGYHVAVQKDEVVFEGKIAKTSENNWFLWVLSVFVLVGLAFIWYLGYQYIKKQSNAGERTVSHEMYQALRV